MYGKVKFVPADALGGHHIIVGEHRKLLGVLRFGSDNRVVQDVAGNLDAVIVHDGAVDVAQQPRMHPGEVPEIGEVLDLP